jgi:CBS domain-containing protein
MTETRIVRVRDVMKTEFDTVDSMALVQDALLKMRHIENKCLIVPRRDEDDEIGMLLISDIARLVLARDRSPHRVNVYEVMAKPVICVHPDMDIRHCAKLLTRFDLSRAPVVSDRGEVLGIVSFTDLVMKGLVQWD